MNKQQELEKADTELKELGSKIEGLKFQLRSLENNMALLNSLRIQFEQNIDVLKSGEIIPAINEFKKIKENLQVANNKLNVMRIDFKNHSVILRRSEKILIELKAKYAILLRNQGGIVIEGSFGGKK